MVLQGKQEGDIANVNVSNQPSGKFRSCLPDIDHPRFANARKQDAHEYVEEFLVKQHPPWLHWLFTHWRSLYEEPFKGVTSDGVHYHSHCCI
jgi:hypothetical protein